MAGAQIDLDDLKINRDGEVPIGVQLAWALRARIGDGRLTPGQRLPGLRELAELVGINANTARSVYQRLEQEGLIDSRQGTGTFVASVSQEPSAVGQIAADAARQARKTGVDPREVAAALYMTTAEAPAGEAVASGERRRELRAQIAALEGTLSEILALNPGLMPAQVKPSRRGGPRLLSVEELEHVRGQLLRRLTEVESRVETTASRDRTGIKARADTATKSTQAATRSGSPGTSRTSRPRPSTRPSTA
ncbi:MAG: GntR family transcriptional regulator [Solirubrobacteraceae bacterium]